MYIERDEQKIELTDEELMKAYMECDYINKLLDIKSEWYAMYENEPWPFNREQEQLLVKDLESFISKDDGYWDSYWELVKATIR